MLNFKRAEYHVGLDTMRQTKSWISHVRDNLYNPEHFFLNSNWHHASKPKTFPQPLVITLKSEAHRKNY